MIFNMEFDCKLAHQKEIKKVSRFKSVRELYQRISEVFAVSEEDILFCTLNTHNTNNMDCLLGSHLTSRDSIIVHMAGDRKTLKLVKTEQYLGLTITDNGNGKAFVKRVESVSGSIEHEVRPGDHIAFINSIPAVGKRHYEVAKILRELPQNCCFTLVLIEPKRSSNDNRESTPPRATPIYPAGEDLSLINELENSSIPISRLLSKSHDSKQAIDSINSTLESFLGISDATLANQIFKLAKDNRDSLELFSKSIADSELKNFNFGKEIETYLWECVTNCANN